MLLLGSLPWELGVIGTIGVVVSIYLTLPKKDVVIDTQPEPEPEISEQVTLYTTDAIKRHAYSCGRPECASLTTTSCTHYQALLSYLEDFLAKPHANVGRTGPVCPFVPLSLKKQTILVGMVRTEASGDQAFDVEDMVTLVRRQRERFLTMEPMTGRMKLYKAIVIGFPDIADEDAPQLIDHVQQRLKLEFTQCGMMIGEFHRLNMTPGLRNPSFRPLQTPIPALAMRFMVPTDVLFLKHDPDYLKAYLSTIDDTQPNAAYRAEAQEAMQSFQEASSKKN